MIKSTFYTGSKIDYSYSPFCVNSAITYNDSSYLSNLSFSCSNHYRHCSKFIDFKGCYLPVGKQ